jgi:hypothetical protein
MKGAAESKFAILAIRWGLNGGVASLLATQVRGRSSGVRVKVWLLGLVLDSERREAANTDLAVYHFLCDSHLKVLSAVELLISVPRSLDLYGFIASVAQI